MKLDDCGKLFAPFKHGHIFVGFSGGADSTAALLIAQMFQKKYSYQLTAIHFDHGLRGQESTREAAAAQQFALDHAIEFKLFKLNLTPGAGIENRARAARLKVWQQLVKAEPHSAVVLGHHADDRAENLLLRLARGANATGLTSMRNQSIVNQVIFLRPLLNFTRAEIEEFLKKNGIFEWANDSSNAKGQFRRNILRNQILPEFYTKLPGAQTGLRRSLEVLELDADFLEEEAARRLQKHDGSASFWQKQHPALLVRMLRRWFQNELNLDLIPPPSFIKRLQNELKTIKPEPRQIPVYNQISLRLQGDSLQIISNTPLPRIIWEFHQKPEIIFGSFRFRAELLTSFPGPLRDNAAALFDAELLPPTLIVRTREAGDSLIPFGQSQPVSLKKLRTDRKIAAAVPCPVVTLPEGEIIWAPLIRHTNYAKVTAQTKQILCLKCTPI